jgi:hypothetical protein
MFERVGNLAERVAIDDSRRTFLGRLGQGALGLAAAIGAVLALPGQARASGGPVCCLQCYLGCGCFRTTTSQGCPSGWQPVDCKSYRKSPYNCP